MTATLTLHRPATALARPAPCTAGATPHASDPSADARERRLDRVPAHPLDGLLDGLIERWAERADRLWREAGDPHRHRYY